MNKLLERQEMKMLNKKRKNNDNDLNKNKVVLRKNIEENKFNEREIDKIKKKFQEQHPNKRIYSNEYENNYDRQRNNSTFNNNNDYNRKIQKSKNNKFNNEKCYDGYEYDIVIKKINSNKNRYKNEKNE